MESLKHTITHTTNDSNYQINQYCNLQAAKWNVYIHVQNKQQILDGMYTYETNEIFTKFLSQICKHLTIVFHTMNSFQFCICHTKMYV